MDRQNTEDFEGNKNHLHAIIMMDIWHYIFVQTHRVCNSKNGPYVNYGVWVMYQCRFILGIKHTTLVSNVDNREPLHV